MLLTHLIEGLDFLEVRGPLGREIASVRDDSREVTSNDLFVAIKGLQHDAHNYAQKAVERGAAAVVVERWLDLPETVTQVLVPNCRRALGYLAASWHGFPTHRMVTIGVTGTDGKSTTCNLIAHILNEAGHKCGIISTVGAWTGSSRVETGLHTTTPEPMALQGYLAEMAASGVDYAVVEVSSHGLDQDRVFGCEFDVAVMTNVTPEHLDYHHTYDEYLRAKLKLFHMVSEKHTKPDVPRVIAYNADDSSAKLVRRLPADVAISYGIENRAKLRAFDIDLSPSGTDFHVRHGSKRTRLTSRLWGRFNVYNILAAVAACWSQPGVTENVLREAVRQFDGIPGRMELVDCGQGFTVVVDFAHTPNGLRQVVETARHLTDGRTIVVFGCPGLRDRGKRPEMGRIACELAHLTVVTGDDSRTEDVNAISQEIAVGCREAGGVEGRDYYLIPDRREAIRFAVEHAAPSDTVLLAGYGHQRTMAVGDQELPWNEVEEARQAIELAQARRA